MYFQGQCFLSSGLELLVLLSGLELLVLLSGLELLGLFSGSGLIFNVRTTWLISRVGHPFFSKERSDLCVLFRSF